MPDDQGMVQSVEVQQFGSYVAVDAAQGTAVVVVEDASDFNDEGGQVSITSANGDGDDVSVVYNYTLERETKTLTLGSNLTWAAPAGDRVDVYPLSYRKVARVLTEGSGDTITAVVPTSLVPYMPEGVRDVANQEPVSLMKDGSRWYIEDILGVRPEMDGTFINPYTLSFSASDGDPPVAATTVTTKGGLGLIFVRWTGITNADFVSYELHCATSNSTPPVAGDTDTLLMETSATLVAAKELPDGTPFDYLDAGGNPLIYYFAVIGKDADGAGPASEWAAGSMNQAASADVTVGAITAETMESVMALVSTLSTRSKDAGGVLTGAGTDITNAGVYCWKSDGTTRFELPNDPLLPAVFRGNAEIDNLTVNNLTTLTSCQLAEGATLTLQASTQPPVNAPTAQVYYQTQQFWVASGSWATRYGWSTDGTYSYTWDQNYRRIEKYSNSTGQVVAYSAQDPNGEFWVDNASVVYDPTNACVWMWDYNYSGFHLSKFTTALAFVSKVTKTEPDENSVVGCIGYDGDHDELVVSKTRTSDSKMVWYRYNNDASLTYQGSIVSSTTFYVTSMAAIRVTADLGADHVIAGARGSSTPMQVYASATGTRDLSREWYNGSNAGKIGAYFNASSGRFVMLDQNGVQYTYEKDGMWWTTPGSDYTRWWQASYTWYSSTGPKQTTRSNFATFSFPKRARILFTAPTRPAGTSSARFWLRYYAADENLGDSYFQAESTATTPTIVVTDALFSGTTSPTENTFSSGTPAKIVSGSAGIRADGEPMTMIVGDGTGRFDGLVPPGAMMMWHSDTEPDGWLLCDGSAVSRALYPDLFAAIGSKFGNGDGVTTFNVPDFMGRMPLGLNPYAVNYGTTIGDNEGDTAPADRDVDMDHTLPDHAHVIESATSHDHNISSVGHTGTTNTTATGGGNRVTGIGGNVSGSHNHGGNTGSGGGHAHGGLTGYEALDAGLAHPFLTVTFIIKV